MGFLGLGRVLFRFSVKSYADWRWNDLIWRHIVSQQKIRTMNKYKKRKKGGKMKENNRTDKENSKRKRRKKGRGRETGGASNNNNKSA